MLPSPATDFCGFSWWNIISIRCISVCEVTNVSSFSVRISQKNTDSQVRIQDSWKYFRVLSGIFKKNRDGDPRFWGPSGPVKTSTAWPVKKMILSIIAPTKWWCATWWSTLVWTWGELTKTLLNIKKRQRKLCLWREKFLHHSFLDASWFDKSDIQTFLCVQVMFKITAYQSHESSTKYFMLFIQQIVWNDWWSALLFGYVEKWWNTVTYCHTHTHTHTHTQVLGCNYYALQTVEAFGADRCPAV